MNKRIIILIFFITVFFNLLLAKDNFAVKVTYNQFKEGKIVEGKSTILTFQNNLGYLSYSDEKESYFIDFKRNESVKILTVSGNKYKLVYPFSDFQKPVFTDDSEIILGLLCKKAVYTVFSNKIEIWYTEEAAAKGSPSISNFPDNSLVMKYVVNGNYILKATAIDTVREAVEIEYPFDKAQKLTEDEYKQRLIKSRYTTIPVFEKEIINFGDSLVNPEEEILNHTYRLSKGTVILKKIKIPEFKESGNLFIKLTNWSNGDAYDRTGTVFTISDRKGKNILDALRKGIEELPVFTDNRGEKYQGIVSTKDYLPPVELIRFFTSFGVGHFNDKSKIAGYSWADSVVYKQEVSELISAKNKEIWLGIFIGNYDKGGHLVSMELNYYPSTSEEELSEKFILPIFNTVNIMEMSGQNYGSLFIKDSLKVEFELPENVKNPRLRFTTTGHGGWGNGDEFNPKLNQIFIDGEEVFRHIP